MLGPQCYAVNKLAAYTANPGLQHHGAIKRILRYLAGTKTLGITYRKSQDGTEEDNLFHGYADAAYANADDLKSTTSYVFLAVAISKIKSLLIFLISLRAQLRTLSKISSFFSLKF
jgi:hypothetical protein